MKSNAFAVPNSYGKHPIVISVGQKTDGKPNDIYIYILGMDGFCFLPDFRIRISGIHYPAGSGFYRIGYFLKKFCHFKCSKVYRMPASDVI